MAPPSTFCFCESDSSRVLAQLQSCSICLYTWSVLLSTTSSRPIHEVAGVRVSFLLKLKNICLYGWTTVCLSDHPSMDTGWFFIFGRLNTAHPCTKISSPFCSQRFRMSPQKCDCRSAMVILCLRFWGDTVPFSRVAAPTCNPISSAPWSQSPRVCNVMTQLSKTQKQSRTYDGHSTRGTWPRPLCKATGVPRAGSKGRELRAGSW